MTGGLADETGAEPGDIRPAVAANAMMGVRRALIDHVRTRVASGLGDFAKRA